MISQVWERRLERSGLDFSGFARPNSWNLHFLWGCTVSMCVAADPSCAQAAQLNAETKACRKGSESQCVQ